MLVALIDGSRSGPAFVAARGLPSFASPGARPEIEQDGDLQARAGHRGGIWRLVGQRGEGMDGFCGKLTEVV